MAFSVVILSREIENLQHCIHAIRVHEPNAKVIVVDDGLEGRYAEDQRLKGPATVPVKYVLGMKPFVFARNANIGIHAAGEDDVVLLNDDAILKTPDGFTRLSVMSTAHPELGVIAAVTDGAGNPNQMPRALGENKGLRYDPRMVCFVCVYLPRRTLNLVGGLDERYVGYGCDDDDYCFRVRECGLQLGILDTCYVDHSLLKSTYRFGKTADFRPNLKLFIAKWGVDNWNKGRDESEFRDLFPEVTT